MNKNFIKRLRFQLVLTIQNETRIDDQGSYISTIYVPYLVELSPHVFLIQTEERMRKPNMQKLLKLRHIQLIPWALYFFAN